MKRRTTETLRLVKKNHRRKRLPWDLKIKELTKYGSEKDQNEVWERDRQSKWG